MIAFVWVATPERVIAASWLVLFELSSWMYAAVWGTNFQLGTVDLVFAATDVLAGIIWLAVALNANRNYPLFIAAMQILAIAGHLSRGLIEAISPIAYAVMVIAPGWIQLLILGTGVIRHILRKRKFGSYREWRTPVKWYGLIADRSGELQR